MSLTRVCLLFVALLHGVNIPCWVKVYRHGWSAVRWPSYPRFWAVVTLTPVVLVVIVVDQLSRL